ncbi:hypothetical protein [Methylobacterium sp. Leaf466]|uniref:hypothetical protein n=1 Tax=Methylobacterium sp. Leaf466 TaxID=1736386 RepID=UPI0012E3EB02|nr:hypothetical protein [Methylobacterium sp. Leaf466]
MMIAEIDAIVRARRKPLSPEHEITGINRALDRALGIAPAAMPPAPANDDEWWVREIATWHISEPTVSPSIIIEAAPSAPAPAVSAMCKKGGASRSRRDALASIVFVGEFLTETGVIQPHRPVHASVSSAKGSPSPSPSRNLRYLEHKIRTAPTTSTTTTKKPPAWRDLDDHAQAVFAFVGLQDHGPVTGFTAHLSDDVNARAYSKEKPGPWLQKQLREQLGKAFSETTDFTINVEETRDPTTGKPRLHVHGVLSLGLGSHRRAKKARAAMRAAFGTWERPGKGKQIKFDHQIDVGWASYASKSARWATSFMRRLLAGTTQMHLAPSFDGAVTMMTRGATRLAKATAEMARQVVLQARLRPSVVPAPGTAPASIKPASGAVMRYLLRPTQEHYQRHLVRIDRHGPDPPSGLTAVNPRATSGDDTHPEPDRTSRPYRMQRRAATCRHDRRRRRRLLPRPDRLQRTLARAELLRRRLRVGLPDPEGLQGSANRPPAARYGRVSLR